MKTTTMRPAERRRRQRARQRAKERRTAPPFADRPQWWQDGLAETPTEEIVATLAGLRIKTDELRFREMASTHGSPDALADAWEAGSTAAGILGRLRLDGGGDPLGALDAGPLLR